MERTFVRTCGLIVYLLVVFSNSHRFQLPTSSSGSPGLHVDSIGDGRVYTVTGRILYRLNSELELEETRNLTSEAVNISLSTDGRWLVVCLTDLSCEVYNATNFSAQSVFRREGAITSAENVALFAAEDSFYVGGVVTSMGTQNNIILSQYGFAGSRVQSSPYMIDQQQFQRNFYGGFVWENNAYYFVTDNNPSEVRGIRVMRVCHNSNFGALYELTLNCGTNSVGLDARIGGITVLDNFAGVSGPTVIISRNRLMGSRNFVCLFSLEMIDNITQQKYDSCTRDIGEVDLAWRSSDVPCSRFTSMQNICNLIPPVGEPPALDNSDEADRGGIMLFSAARINLGFNFITASTAAVVDSFSFVFVAYTDRNGNSFLSGFDLGSTSGELMESNGFDRRDIMGGPVEQLQLNVDAGLIYAVTDTSVLAFPIADCTSHPNCTSCVGNGNPLCGWCVVENKCSKITKCQNSTSSTRWIRAAGTNTDQCPLISVTPKQYIVDSPMSLTLTLTQSLPTLLDDESYLCHFNGNGVLFTVDAIGSGTNYTCNITGRIPMQFQGLSAVLNVSLASSLLMIPFSTNNSAITIYQCNATSSCSQCLQTDNACGWCVYNKVCSGSPATCINGSDAYLQTNLVLGKTFTDVCPFLDQPSVEVNYTQPVQLNRNLKLVTRNLPPEFDGFNYMCRVGSVNLPATYNNETSLTCSVAMGQLTLPSGTGQQVMDITIRWVGQGIDHPIDVSTPVSVVLFNCADLAGGCSSCLGSAFDCQWCDRPNGMTDSCTYTGLCEATTITMGTSCPNPKILDFNPKSGPVQGGTTITITGTDLGVTFDDFAANSITIGDVPCTPTDRESYIPGKRIRCNTTTQEDVTTGPKTVLVSILSRAGTSNIQFIVANPQISQVTPALGPMAGGTRLTVRGSNLNIGNLEETTITLAGGTQCVTYRSSIQENSINCTTSEFTGTPGSNTSVVVTIDDAIINNASVQFTYTFNPEFISISPSNTILAGGITLIFNGSYLDVVQNPVLVINDSAYLDNTNMTSCTVINSTAISCVVPPLNYLRPGDADGLNYAIIMDNAPGPDLSNENLQISVEPNPDVFGLIESEYNTGTSAPIRIRGVNLLSVGKDVYNVTVGGESCMINAVTQVEINCIPPTNPPRGLTEAIVIVRVGFLINTLPVPLTYVQDEDIPLIIIIPVVAGVLLAVVVISVIIICCVVCLYRRKSKKNEQRWTNLLSQMELMELEMADECKRAFTELQTDLADLVQISDANLPYRDFRSFAMRFLFPHATGEHPVLIPLDLPEKTDRDQVIENLKSFQSLIMDKKFLLVFIRTLESQGAQFTLQDKCNVASLLMVAFQNDLDYATDILQTLLSELMRKSINNKSHPKLLLRRTESVAEKMLANWLAFLLFPYLLEHVGQPLFTLYRAIKSQLEKGPVDIITGEARHSLSEEKLLRQHIEVKIVEGVIEPNSGGDDIPIKMLDCDSITQAKEKVLDTLYKNSPASKRPQLTEIDLTLQCGTASLTLRDQDQTNRRDGDWTRVNTLGHYNVDEMSQKHANNPKLPIPRFKLEKRPTRPVSGASFDALGTIIANIGAESRANMMMSGELSHVYHLVKTEADESDDVEKRGGKIMSEVFLTRLLSTKRILQPYVDKVFESIFTVPHGRQLPKAIKSLFDFLDLQASDLGIQDSEILHTWKTNSVPLRFWVNVIKNPDFVFDIHKSATVDACLTVIAQAYIDACSTTEMKYTKETPSARLLYVNEVKKYKQDVQSYYDSVQSQPKLSQYEMGEYLRETAQVCANSVKNSDPDIDSTDLGPASMTRQLYFVTESALHEVFKFAAKYSEDIIDGLNEEGLSIMATNFQQLKTTIPV